MWRICCRWSVEVRHVLEHLHVAYYMPWMGMVAESGREGHGMLACMVL